VGWIADAVGDFPTARPLNWDADPGDDMLGDGFIQRYVRWRNPNAEDLPGRNLFGAALAQAMTELEVGLMRREDYVRCPKCCEGCTAFADFQICCTDCMDKHLGDLNEFADLVDLSKIDIKRWTCATRCLKRSLWVFIPLCVVGGCAANCYFCCDDVPKESAVPLKSIKVVEEKNDEQPAVSPSSHAGAAAASEAESDSFGQESGAEHYPESESEYPRNNDYVERGRPDGNSPYFRESPRLRSESLESVSLSRRLLDRLSRVTYTML